MCAWLGPTPRPNARGGTSGRNLGPTHVFAFVFFCGYFHSTLHLLVAFEGTSIALSGLYIIILKSTKHIEGSIVTFVIHKQTGGGHRTSPCFGSFGEAEVQEMFAGVELAQHCECNQRNVFEIYPCCKDIN